MHVQSSTINWNQSISSKVQPTCQVFKNVKKYLTCLPKESKHVFKILFQGFDFYSNSSKEF